MNYMKMIKFKSVDLNKSTASLSFQEREEDLKNELECNNIVPYFTLIEAIFQTAGRVAREHSQNMYGRIIVSFNEFCFHRPVFLNEKITIKAKIVSYNENLKIYFFSVSVYGENDIIIKDGAVLIKQEKIIKSNYLNNSMETSIEENMNKCGYNERSIKE